MKATVVLISYVWPEPQSSAAGLRDLHLIQGFRRAGYQVVIASAAQNEPGRLACENWAQEWADISVRGILLNHSSFDDWISALKPEVVIFDRFISEEQFGWRVRDACPEAVCILDTQDLHFLRLSREEVLQRELKQGSWQRVRGGIPSEWNSDSVCRELASIHRVDLTWVVSGFEKELLVQDFGVDPSRLLVSRFAYPQPEWSPGHPANEFERRSGFVLLGNFRHPPNLDAFRWLLRQIWPRVRELIPEAQLYVYGAYPPKEAMQGHSPATGVFVCGPAANLDGVFRDRRVSLAPLRFGAGIKGKISDSWWYGLPVVSTSIGLEGMGELPLWGGLVADDEESFAQACKDLHESQDLWCESRERAGSILDRDFSERVFQDGIRDSMVRAKEAHSRLKLDWIRQMLCHSSLESHRYFGKWIELKEQARARS